MKLALLFVALTTSPVLAQRSLVIERFDATITVNPDASIGVAESITARFTGSWNGIYRTIPIEYRTPQGFNWSLRLELQSATDSNGQSLKVETNRERHYIKYKIWVTGAVDATRTITLRYRAKNALRFFDDHDELYWNITGDEWDVPIESAQAEIRLPPGAGGVRATAFNGVYGSTTRDAEVSTENQIVRVVMPHRLDFREGVTAVVGWNKGIVTAPTGTDRVADFLASNWPLLIPFPVFFGMLLIWRAKGKDPSRLPIAVQYEPPDGLTPAEAGTLIDNTADMRDITATIVDLAVRGFIRIEEQDTSRAFGLIHKREFVFHLVKMRGEWTKLAGHERAVLDGIFTSGSLSVELSELHNKFYSRLSGIRDDIFSQLLARRFYAARPDSVQGRWIAAAIGLGVLTVFAGAKIAEHWGVSPVAFVIAGIAVAIVIGGFGIVMPARTVAGARALERILGYVEFLSRVEGDHLRQITKTPELFERGLPFAMAFGVEKQWAKTFEGIYTAAPTWYAGANPTSFNAGYFSSRLSTLSSQAGSTMASSPRSSSGSGFSGGSSGGGGGGGGGGGF